MLNLTRIFEEILNNGTFLCENCGGEYPINEQYCREIYDGDELVDGKLLCGNCDQLEDEKDFFS